MPQPSTIRLLHHRQEFAASCLAACAKMALSRWGIAVSEGELRRILKVRRITGGHPISLLNLVAYGVNCYVDSGTLGDVRAATDRGDPVIVFLWTAELPYWTEADGVDYLHSVVVVGIAEDVLLHDPSLPQGPTNLNVEAFLAAWRFSGNLMCPLTHAQNT